MSHFKTIETEESSQAEGQQGIYQYAIVGDVNTTSLQDEIIGFLH